MLMKLFSIYQTKSVGDLWRVWTLTVRRDVSFVRQIFAVVETVQQKQVRDTPSILTFELVNVAS